MATMSQNDLYRDEVLIVGSSEVVIGWYESCGCSPFPQFTRSL